MARLTVYLLGPPEIHLDGDPISGLHSDKVRALLFYLAVERGLHRRESLAGLLWPDYPERSARTSLSNTLSHLRTALDDRQQSVSFFHVDRQTIQWNSASDTWVDANVFAEHMDRAQWAEEVDMYRGPFLDGFSLPDSPAFEQWAVVVRERMQRQAMEALAHLATQHEAQGDLRQAIQVSRRQIEIEPGHEEAHRTLMRLLALDGQRSAALAQYEACVRVLDEDLNVRPGVETSELYEAIRDGKIVPSKEAPRRRHAPTTPSALTGAVGTPVPLAPSGERRWVTALHAEVYRAADLLDDLGPEQWITVTSRALEAVEEEAARFGGQVIQRQEDGAIALFGLETAHEDDPERAVLAAMGMQKRTKDTQLLSIGVDTGEVLATYSGERHQMVGRALTLARRASVAAKPGEVSVGDNTYRLVRGLFEWAEKADEKALRGRHPLTHKVGAGKGRGLPGLSSPLVGRHKELGALQAAVERLCSGIGGIITIVGEAGIGKSRLVAECRSGSQTAPAAPLQWIEGRCLSYTTNTAYQLWLDLARQILGVSSDTSPHTVRDALQDRIRALCPDDYDDVYPYLSRLLSLPLDDEARVQLRGVEGEGLQTLTFAAIGALIEGAAGRQPLVVVCEDLHWADPTSVALLERLLTLTERAAVLFFCVLRPDTEHPCWRIVETAARRYRYRHTDLRLDPLSTKESAALVGNLLHVGDLPLALRERLLDHAEGNPFYVEELIRSLIDSGAIVQDAETQPWRATRDVDDIAIPDTLHGVLVARIDRLEEETRRVLQLASVIGRVFLYRVLAEIVPQEREVSAHLLTLQRETLIREHARVPELAYAFKHQLTQEAAYSGLLRQERRAYHRQVAESLERLFADRLDEVLGLLSHHWERAEETQQAVHYLQQAGEQAAAHYANAEALNYLSRALELTPEADPARRYALLSARARIYDLQGQWALQGEDLAQLAALAAVLDESDPQPGRSRQAEVLVLQADNAGNTQQGAEIIALAQKAVSLAQAAHDPASEALGYQQWAHALWMQGVSERMAKLEQALALCQDAHLVEVEIDILLSIGKSFELDPAQAQLYYQRALRLCQETGNRRGESEALHQVGMVLQAQGKLAEAIPYLERSLQLGRAIGDRRNESWALQILGEICLDQGRYAEGAAYCEQALASFREIEGDMSGLDAALWALVQAAQDHGQPEKAIAYLEQAVRYFRERGDRFGEAGMLSDAGRFLMDLGRYDEAHDYMEQGLRLLRGTRDPWVEAWTLARFAQYYMYHGDYDRARASAEQSLHVARDVNLMQGIGQAAMILGLIALNRGDHETAHQLGEQALSSALEAHWPGLESLAWRVLGGAAAGLRQWDEAAKAYSAALQVTQVSVGIGGLRRVNQDCIIEPRAGLARVALAQGDLAGALAHVEAILEYLADYPGLRCAYEPLRVYLICYQVLDANADARARNVLSTAYDMLQERVAHIADEEMRRSCLENVSYNREIVAEWERLA
ncbi:MAG: tetratricopeptide repeat protein, partial [Anaerolineae bacterium]